MSLGSTTDEEVIEVGNLVRIGPNLFPHFSVLTINGDEALVRNLADGKDKTVRVSQCRKINGRPGFDQAAD